MGLFLMVKLKATDIGRAELEYGQKFLEGIYPDNTISETVLSDGIIYLIEDTNS